MTKLSEKLIALCMALFMLVAMALPVAAADTPILISAQIPAAWDGSVATAYAGGTGTEADPYLISTAAELALIAKNVNEKTTDYAGTYFKQTADINLDGATWVAIGCGKSSSLAFKGNYDGASKIIYNILCTPIDEADANDKIYNGLFGWIEGATVQNVRMMGGTVSSTKYAGAIVGYAKGGNIYNCISELESVIGWQVGGVVGRSDSGETVVKGCVNHSTVSSINTTESSNAFVGGILGVAGNTTISYCANYGDITGSNAKTQCSVGGIIGVHGASSAPVMIYNCVDMGTITGKELEVTKNLGVGGIAGRAGHVGFGEIINCIAVGTYICDRPDYVGGIAGQVTNNIVIAENIYTNFEKVSGLDANGFFSEGKVLKTEEMKGAAGITAMGLNGAWVAEADMFPSIDVTKIAAAEKEEAEATATTTATTTTTTTTTSQEAVTTTTATEEVTTTPTLATETEVTEVTTVEPTENDPAQTPDNDTDGPNNMPVETRDNTVLIIILSVAIVAVIGAMVAVMVVSKKKAQ